MHAKARSGSFTSSCSSTPLTRQRPLPTMNAASDLHRSLGFREISPYTVGPVPGTRFLELDL